MAEGNLSVAGKSALISFIRVVADGENCCERARVAASEAPDFVPSEAFKVLQGTPPKGYISIRDVHSWLADQPHRLPRLLHDDIAEFLLPHCNSGSELRYDAFLKLVLPRDDPALREISLNRNANVPFTHARDFPGGHMSPDTCYRLCRLFEEEIDLSRHLHFHRKALRELNVNSHNAYQFLSLVKATVSIVGFLSQAELRVLLVDQLRELTGSQSDAFYRRASNTSTAGLTLEDMMSILKPFDDGSIGAASPRPYSPVSPRPITSAPQLSMADERALADRRALHDSVINHPRSFYNLYPLSMEIVSPRSLSAYRRPLSPHTMSPRTMDHSRALEKPITATRLTPDLQSVLQVIERQGQLDGHIEEVKTFLPPTTPLEAIFGMLDIDKKDHISDTDLWHFAQKFGRLPFSTIFALIREIQNSRQHDPGFIAGQLSLREVGVLVHKRGTLEHEAMDGSSQDHEARSSLYVMRYTEACPGCGLRIQRDADATGCPNVTCPSCRKTFQCFTTMGDTHVIGRGIDNPTNTDHMFQVSLPMSVQQDVYRIIEASANSADEIEGLRKQLTLAHSPHLVGDAFNLISGGKKFFTFVDLRRVLFQYKYWSSERELQLIWHRYARGSDKVTSQAFTQQLEPVMGKV